MFQMKHDIYLTIFTVCEVTLLCNGRKEKKSQKHKSVSVGCGCRWKEYEFHLKRFNKE